MKYFKISNKINLLKPLIKDTKTKIREKIENLKFLQLEIVENVLNL